MKKLFFIGIMACVIMLTSCVGDIASATVPQATPEPFATVAASIVSATAPEMSVQSESYATFLAGLDDADMTAASAAVTELLTRHMGQQIPDDEVTLLLEYIEGMTPRIQEPTDIIDYPNARVTTTAWHIESIRMCYDHYFLPRTDEGMLFFVPDYMRIGNELYECLSDGYKEFFNVRFQLTLHGVEYLYADGRINANDSRRWLAIDIYEDFISKYPDLAAVHGYGNLAGDLRKNLKPLE